MENNKETPYKKNNKDLQSELLTCFNIADALLKQQLENSEISKEAYNKIRIKYKKAGEKALKSYNNLNI